ncbi:uncharacterized protein LOC142345978 isoform X1 [Convolutriloba macropyga]|uniref:uncharacterized protein LOC142345978 isoform X1 n=1 Tax=Convolutriloba macropyga TaxID=536237 RepID=UPI003F51BF4C
MDNRPSSNGTYGATSSRNTRIDAAIDRAQTEAHAATSAVRDTLGKFKDRDDKLRDLQQRTGDIATEADNFTSSTRKIKSQQRKRSRIMCVAVIASVTIVAIFIAIIVFFFIK